MCVVVCCSLQRTHQSRSETISIMSWDLKRDFLLPPRRELAAISIYYPRRCNIYWAQCINCFKFFLVFICCCYVLMFVAFRVFLVWHQMNAKHSFVWFAIDCRHSLEVCRSNLFATWIKATNTQSTNQCPESNYTACSVSEPWATSPLH